MAIGKDTLTDIIKHYDENGATPRLRKKRAQPQPRSRRFISHEVIHTVVEFVKNYAEVHSIMLPGRHPGHKDWHVKLLPTHVTKASVWRLYVKSAKELGEPAVCKSSFRSLWKQLLPHIRSCRPRTDLCWQCQSNNEQLIRSANVPDERKSEVVQKQVHHLALVQNPHRQQAKTSGCITASTLHSRYTFPQTLCSRGQCISYGLFGVSCEGMQKQVNFLIDEGMSSSKGSNEVISYMHHFFNNFGVGEKYVDLHCDNCSGQNKNNFMLWYAAWLVGHKLHHTMDIHFLIAGHTKFSPDCGFGLIKRAYMKTRVDTLEDIAEVSLCYLTTVMCKH
ncbi:uncharacterized protein [Eucyclogobius newberryi]|uniref:uncharacterized protein n=1 Tax=Eucyclogobius newberryi TaxID=166745 RepID=UPI003B5A93AD